MKLDERLGQMTPHGLREIGETKLQQVGSGTVSPEGKTFLARLRRVRRCAFAPLAGRGFIVLLAPLVGLLLLLAISLIYMFILSLRTFDKGLIQQEGLTLANYQRFMFDPFYLRILGTTFVIAALVVLATIILGYPVAYYISRAERWKTLLIALTMTPLLISAVIRVYSWVYLLGNAGFINRTLQDLGWIRDPLPLMYNRIGVAIGLIHVFMPFMILSLLAALQNIDRNLEEAARGLGAGPLGAFATVTLPLSVPGIIAGSLLVFTLTIASYITPAVLGSSADKLIALLEYEVFYETGNWPFGSAIAFILVVVSLIVTVGYFRLMERQMGGKRI
ncbi:MAG: ABC transporter permease [Candidatus Methylomirabilota bacterium]